MKCWLVLPMLLLASALHAAVETYQFSSPALETRYHHLTSELRCPKCQNQSLASSGAPIAADLRRKLHRMLEEGRSDHQIIDFMVSRYGNFVLYDPRFNRQTAVLWLAPAGFLLVGAVVVLLIYRRQKNAALVAVDDAPLSDDEQRRLRQLLDEGDKDSVND